ncbi:MAG: hypothetical protein PHY28_08940 [Dehalococcoidales bacterium]|nr:hypothetical protein [Dehalococcoidales bacterium]
MFWKKKQTTTKEAKCPHCGAECYDAQGLERHVSWVHKEEKQTVK